MNQAALWTGEAIVEAVHATGGPGANRFTGVSIDSRTVHPGDLFIALKGPSQNGHDYVLKAFEKGAIAAIVSENPQGLSNNARLIWVPDTLEALEHLGKSGRARSRGKIVAVTGSVGKTGTKEALAHVLSSQGITSASALSYNNQWGVPLSLARLPEAAAYGIFEVGMNHPGEIVPLTHMVAPHVALITTVVGAHQEFFASVEDIALAKAEIFQGVVPGGTAVLNRDNPYFDLLHCKALEAGIPQILSFGFHPAADVRALSHDLQEDSTTVEAVAGGESLSYRLSHPGLHWVSNSLAVLAVMVALKISPAQVTHLFATLPPLNGRGRRHRLTLRGKTITLLDESYNANPVSMAAALEVLGRVRPQEGGRRIVVLGDMRELGEGGLAAHLALKPLLAHHQIDCVLTCGPLMAHLYATLPPAQQSVCVEKASDLLAPLHALLQEGDILMLKGSKSVGLEPIVHQLVQEGHYTISRK